MLISSKISSKKTFFFSPAELRVEKMSKTEPLKQSDLIFEFVLISDTTIVLYYYIRGKK